MKNPIVVTGLGVISGLGIGVAPFRLGLFSGQDAVSTLTLFDPDSVKSNRVAQVKEYDAANFFTEKQLPFYDRYAQFAAISAREAVANAGWIFNPNTSTSNATFGCDNFILGERRCSL